MDPKKWLAINYNLPTEPSRIRVAVWRNLKKLGAVNIQQSMWVLPYSDENHSSLSDISSEIGKNSGEAFIMQTVFPDERDEQKVITLFNKARDEEYKEVLEKCADFFKEIEKETERRNFTFAEVEENEEELQKLFSWNAKVNARDVFSSPLREKASLELEECKGVFEEFSDKVYKFCNLT